MPLQVHEGSMKQQPFIVRVIFKTAMAFTLIGGVLVVGGIAAGLNEAHHSETTLEKQQ